MKEKICVAENSLDYIANKEYGFFIKGETMKIEILGTGCPKCKKLYENTLTAVQASGVSAQVEKIEDMEKIINHGVMSTPAIAVDGIVKSAGKLLSPDEIRALISK